jgi:hypothetical protein
MGERVLVIGRLHFFIAFMTSFSHNSSIVSQITRNNVVAEGRLAYNLTAGKSANPRWLVKFDNEPWKDEELYEHTFGKLLKTSKLSSSSEGEEASKKKSVTFSEEVSDSSSSKVRALAREQRSTRRQAKIQVDKKRPLKNSVPANKRVKTNNNEEVVMVQMLTGTLYLYRGLNRRAEFIRKS